MKSNIITSTGHSSNTLVVGSRVRTFKFRFWSPDKRMLDDHDGWVEDTGINYALACSKDYGYVAMPFTGFKDIKGKEIYEGDILSVWYSRDTTGKDIVKFNHTVKWEDTNGFSGWNIPFLKTAEIIGNVFQTPELAE